MAAHSFLIDQCIVLWLRALAWNFEFAWYRCFGVINESSWSFGFGMLKNCIWRFFFLYKFFTNDISLWNFKLWGHNLIILFKEWRLLLRFFRLLRTCLLLFSTPSTFIWLTGNQATFIKNAISPWTLVLFFFLLIYRALINLLARYIRQILFLIILLLFFFYNNYIPGAAGLSRYHRGGLFGRRSQTLIRWHSAAPSDSWRWWPLGV